ncbi:MAG TPA: hypothetical protein VII99_17500, partial [Bacteroidia bacterium]
RKIPHSSNGTTVDYYLADVTSANDYYAFGMLMPGRSFNNNSYDFGFGGQMKVDEVTGSSGTHYTAEFWEYDPRTGRRWNTDPIIMPWESPYATFSNNPIYFSDPTGAQSEGPDDPPSGAVKKDDEAWLNELPTVEVVAQKSANFVSRIFSSIGNFFSSIGSTLRKWDAALDLAHKESTVPGGIPLVTNQDLFPGNRNKLNPSAINPDNPLNVDKLLPVLRPFAGPKDLNIGDAIDRTKEAFELGQDFVEQLQGEDTKLQGTNANDVRLQSDAQSNSAHNLPVINSPNTNPGNIELKSLKELGVVTREGYLLNPNGSLFQDWNKVIPSERPKAFQ